MNILYYILGINLCLSLLFALSPIIVVDVDMSNWGATMTPSKRAPIGLTVGPIIFVDSVRVKELSTPLLKDKDPWIYLLNHEYTHYKQYIYATPLGFGVIYGLNTWYLKMKNQVHETYMGRNIFEAQAVLRGYYADSISFDYYYISLRGDCK